MPSDPPQTDNAAPQRVARPRIRPSARQQLHALSNDRMRQFLVQRLRFSALALAVTLTALLLLKAVAGLWGTVWLVFASVLVTCIWGLTTGLEQMRQTARESSLRRTEVFVFGCSFAALACLTFANLEATCRTHEFQKYMLTIRESLLISTVLVMIYGVVIPNRSRRSLLVASALAAVPVGTVALSLMLHVTSFPEALVALRLQFAIESLIPLTAAICCATIGAGVSERIRDRNLNIEELGSYVLKEPLGSGGMGDVYLAEHRLLKRLCAVKLIHPDKAGDARVKARFEQEVKATAGLTHPNTVQVYDYGTTHGGRFFYAMEFLEGLNLYQYVQQFGPMPPARVVYVLRQICGALHEAWCEGLVHRDIKPSNIFLSERGHVFDVAKLLDFGLVQPAIGLRRVHTQIQGSPAFMCPEQASGMEPDCRGDLYSLGAVAWFLLTGQPPYRDHNPVMLIVAHATEPVPNFADAGFDVPHELAEIVMKCLAKKPGERYSHPRELLLALEDCDVGNVWTWKDAEDWWLAHIPAHGEQDRLANECAFDTPEDSHVTPGMDPLEKTLIVDRDAVPVGQV